MPRARPVVLFSIVLLLPPCSHALGLNSTASLGGRLGQHMVDALVFSDPRWNAEPVVGDAKPWQRKGSPEAWSDLQRGPHFPR